jgi:hypothetical protein
MNLSDVHNKYKSRVMSTEYRAPSTTLSNRLLRRLEMVRIALLFVIFVSFTGIANSQTYDPTICDEGDSTPWIGPITAWAVGIPEEVLGCDDDSCIVTITYYKRYIPGWGWEFQIATITFEGCDAECMENAWNCAWWMIATKYKVQLGINVVDGCYETFHMRAATCWEYDNSLPTISQYKACGGECCVGMYRICRRLGPSGTYFEFTELAPIQNVTNTCETPCEFIDCENTMPGNWSVTDEPPAGGDLLLKLSIYESVISDRINFHPNPTDGNVIVSFDLPEKGVYTFSVFDNLGNEIFNQEVNSGANLNVEFELKSNSFATGTYNVVVSGNNGEIMNGKFIKVK